MVSGNVESIYYPVTPPNRRIDINSGDMIMVQCNSQSTADLGTLTINGGTYVPFTIAPVGNVYAFIWLKLNFSPLFLDVGSVTNSTTTLTFNTTSYRPTSQADKSKGVTFPIYVWGVDAT